MEHPLSGRGYSNALNSGRLGKLETIPGTIDAWSPGGNKNIPGNGSFLETTKGNEGKGGTDGAFVLRDESNVRKTLCIIYEFSFCAFT